MCHKMIHQTRSLLRFLTNLINMQQQRYRFADAYKFARICMNIKYCWVIIYRLVISLFISMPTSRCTIIGLVLTSKDIQNIFENIVLGINKNKQKKV